MIAKPGAANAYGLVQGQNNAIAAGKRPLSSMTPAIIAVRTGGPVDTDIHLTCTLLLSFEEKLT
jgi:hypothetical protein